MAMTKGQGAAVNNAASQHDATAETFKNENQRIEGNVADFMTKNWGDVARWFDQIQNEWRDNVNIAIGKIGEMANTLRENQSTLGQTDAG